MGSDNSAESSRGAIHAKGNALTGFSAEYPDILIHRFFFSLLTTLSHLVRHSAEKLTPIPIAAAVVISVAPAYHTLSNRLLQSLQLKAGRDRAAASKVLGSACPCRSAKLVAAHQRAIALQRRDRPAFAIWRFEWYAVPAPCIFGPFGGKLDDTGAKSAAKPLNGRHWGALSRKSDSQPAKNRAGFSPFC